MDGSARRRKAAPKRGRPRRNGARRRKQLVVDVDLLERAMALTGMFALRFAIVVPGNLLAPLVSQQLMAQMITWPTGGWPSATPESQGLDSSVLADMLEFVQEQQLPVHSVLIVRHGHLVLDAHFYPYTPT